jgi:hypothetical protein
MTKSNTQVQQPARADEAEYFNLHASGCGYLSRVRWVDPGKRRGGRAGDQFLACAINALRGDVANPSYTYFDLRVSGEEAAELIDQLKPSVDENRKVFVAFKLGDFYAHSYERDARDNRGQKTGEKEISALIKGRLLLITHVKVDGEVVYQRDDDAAGGEGAKEERVHQGDETPAQQAGAGSDDEESPGARNAVTAGERSVRRPEPQRRSASTMVDRTRVRSYAETASA